MLTDSGRLLNIDKMTTELTLSGKAKIKAITMVVFLVFSIGSCSLEEVGMQTVDSNLSDDSVMPSDAEPLPCASNGSDSIGSPSGPKAIGRFDGGEPEGIRS